MEETDALRTLMINSHRGVLATIRRDSRPQLSNVVYTFDPASDTVRFSTTTDRAKTHNIRRDPRATFHVQGDNFWSFVVADTTAAITEVTQSRDDAVADELVEVYREIGGEHPNWDEYRTEMVKEQRVVIRLHVERLYGKP